MGSNEADIFADTLKKHVQKSCTVLYSDNKINIQNICKDYNVQDVISNISKQIKAFQNADSVGKCGSSRNNLDVHKTNSLLSVTTIATEQHSEQIQSSKFETQCVLDTQLINFLEDAEALIDVPKGMTQEFDNSFNNSNDNRQNDENPQRITDENTNYIDSKELKVKESISKMDSLTKVCDNNSPENPTLKCNENCEIVCKEIKSIEANRIIESDVNKFDECDEEGTPKSLIIGINDSPILKSKPAPSLVYKLELFERFEAIAVPIIKDNLDFDVAKRLINSKMNNELFIQLHTEPVLGDRDKTPSPILNIGNKSHSKHFDRIETKNNPIIEDKLLFSSDEEDDLKNGFEDLPLTCALETSFYKQHDVLDKTMYVGFQTASNKSIQVHSTSYSKAKSILDNVKIPKEDFSLSRLVEVIDSSVKSNDISVTCKDNKTILKDIERSNNVIRPMAGFKTGSGEDIKISDAGLMKSKRIFEEVLVSDKDTSLLNTNFSSDNMSCNKKINLSEKIFDASKKDLKINTQLSLSADNNAIYTGLDENGLLSELVNIDEDILNEFESNFIVNENNTEDKDTILNGKAINTEQSATKDDVISQMVVNERPFVGFKTANDKEIKISEQGLAKTKNIFEDINLNDLQNYSNDGNTAYFQKFSSYVDQPSTSKTFMGFRTATNKIINVSPMALAKTKNIFDNIDDEDETTNNINATKKKQDAADINNPMNSSKRCQGFVNPVSSPKNIKDILLKPENSFNMNHDLQRQTSTFTGFQTASIKPVKISSEALAKSEILFKDIMCTQSDKESYKVGKMSVKNTTDVNQLQNPTETEQVLIKSHENISYIKTDISSCDPKPKIQGFKTASNKTVPISDVALARTKTIFQDIMNNMEIDSNSSNNDGINIEEKNICESGLKSANIKPVSIAEKALSPVFQGFKTASNKAVNISETALAKTKKIFQDINKDDEPQESAIKVKTVQTGNNKNVEISKEALVKRKKIFEGIDLNQDKFYKNYTKPDRNRNMNEDTFGFKTADNRHVNIAEDSSISNDGQDQDIVFNPKNISKDKITSDNDYNLNIDELMNTEVIKNFEETLYTEDFSKDTSLINKRSGSPILSCPRTKRKRFKTPQSTTKINVTRNTEEESPINVYKFKDDYKKNKKYKLKDIQNLELSCSNSGNIDTYVLNFKFDTLLDFEFGGKRNDIDNDIWTTDNIIKHFTESVNRKIVPDGWIKNHLRLIIWKLLSYEFRFPACMNNICTVNNVLHQLKYRFDKELYNVERPALRKILEKDELASKLVVLCVAGLYINGVYVSSVTNQMQNVELLVTDGWYCVKASADKMIDSLISTGKIGIGTKLAIYGAELMNCEQGVSPWEDTSSIRLKISGNSTRRAKWDSRLGFHGNGAILARLSAVKPEGGKISRVRVFVTRVYPTLYIEKFVDGSTVTRSERLEHLEQLKHETDRQNQIEKLYDEIEKMADQDSEDSEGLDSDKGLDTGSQICRLMKRSKDLSGFKVNLTESQAHLLEQHTMKKRERMIQNLQAKVQDMVKKRGLDVARNVVPLLKIRVADVYDDCVSKAMITVWRPNECVLDLIAEGAWLDVYNIVPTAVRFSEIQISAGRQSIFQSSKFNKDIMKKHTDTLTRKCYHIKDLQTTTNTDYNEIDTFGLIFLIEPPTNLFQNIYLTDQHKNLISINFWGGIKKFGLENILDTGQIVSCLNLQKRSGNTKKEIAQYRATEFSHFTRTCKIDYIRKMTEELSTKFLSIDKKKFINDCVAIKNNFINLKYGNTENVTPYKLNNSDFNITKNRVFIESPLAQKVDIHLNLTGLDFESTFKQTDTQDLSAKELARKRIVNEKIAKLKMYGEPPPLSSIHITNKSNSIKPYKSPLITKRDISPNVTSAKEIPNNVELNSSPVLINRSYVKCLNPVKLNFAADEDKDSTTDPFAEEFDCSPPLSLE